MEKKNTPNSKRYGGLDGLRTIACIGIIMMHMRANNTYAIQSYAYDTIIKSFTNFVFLFMVVSAFGLCCGYRDRMLDGTLSIENFYKKRYSRILPFFAFLVLIDVLMERSRAALIEGFADVTLLFGLFPNDIQVIGVGWFLGLVFAFYLIFPFFCVLIRTKKRAWVAFILAVIMNYVFSAYFGIGRHNIVYSLCYFLAGGLIYLYREPLEVFSRKHRVICIGIAIGAITLYYAVYHRIGDTTAVAELLVSGALMTLALGSRQNGILQNRFTKFFSSISMEVYLSHMVIFRAIEKIGMNAMFGNGWLQYFATVSVVLAGAILFSAVCRRALTALNSRLLASDGERS